jgi:hypothetical protein
MTMAEALRILDKVVRRRADLNRPKIITKYVEESSAAHLKVSGTSVVRRIRKTSQLPFVSQNLSEMLARDSSAMRGAREHNRKNVDAKRSRRVPRTNAT